jgi:hypothetical protein
VVAKTLPALARIAQAAAELRARKAASPLAYVRWFIPQQRWLALRAKIKLLRAGNQVVGKTWAGIAETVGRCLGTHPYYATKAPPIKVIVCNLNHTQSLAIQGKFDELIPKGELAKGCSYNSGTGWGANNPRITFRNGSQIKFVTDEQGPRAVAGATVDFIWVDEPCSPEMMRELRMRILANAGDMAMTLTPINGPVQHIEEMVASGEIVEVHAPLTLETMTYYGTTELRRLPDGTLCDQAWIDHRWAKEPAMWAPIILDGDWMAKAIGAWFAAVWDANVHVNDRAEFDEADGTASWHLGIDYASADRPMGLVASLLRVQVTKNESGEQREFIIVEDMVALPGTATMDMFAADILAMLTRNGLKWRSLKTVYGDNPVKTRFEFKSNLDLTKKLARRLKIPQAALLPKIIGAKEGRASSGTKDTGCRYLYEAIASNRFLVRSRCKAMAEAIETWDYGNQHPAKDRIDTLRYALKDYVFSSSNPHAPMRRIMVGARPAGRVAA